ncbi:MAG: hypothetical protein IBJ10_04255, partial [Phycisphaerales bacterium]|nr:hypothetical protein [Phycisphaerales bacterium]
SDTLVADGTVFYFHPQLKGNGSCSGMLSPCGIINSKPDVDLYQVAELSSTTSGNGGINDAGGATVISTESQVLLYQNLDPALVIRPIQMTVRRDTTTPGRFTVTGPGISNGSITFQGRFRHIGTTYVTGDADSNGARPYTLHTRGEKHFLGLPVVFVVVPDSNFSDVSPFLANNLLARRVTFAADNQADVTTAGKNFTFAANAPIVFNINADNVWEYPLSGLEQDDWAFLPASATSPTRANVGGPGQDFGTAANQPNRLLVPGAAPNTTTPANAVTAFPPNTTARGFFVMLDTFTNEPVILDMVTALALDTRGVYCGAVRGLNRIATGYAYAIEFASGTNYGRYSWFTFGTLVEDINAASLAVTPNGSNGGWHLLNNGSGNDITASTASIGGNQIFMSMDSAEGVRIFIEGQPQFSDFESVAPNHGYLLFTDMAISNFR